MQLFISDMKSKFVINNGNKTAKPSVSQYLTAFAMVHSPMLSNWTVFAVCGDIQNISFKTLLTYKKTCIQITFHASLYHNKREKKLQKLQKKSVCQLSLHDTMETVF